VKKAKLFQRLLLGRALYTCMLFYLYLIKQETQNSAGSDKPARRA